MIGKSYFFKRVVIVGVGLMGGSLGLAIKKKGVAREVIGLSHRQSSLVEAMKLKAIDVGLTDVKKAIGNADLVVLAAPVYDIIKLMPTINPHLRRNCIVTDLGSSKVDIVEAAEKHLSNPTNFVGSHPLVGSEKKGVANAREDLFDNALCIMTPTNKTHKVATEKVRQLWTRVGAEVKTLAPIDHDSSLSYISHLPHLVAYGMMESMPQKYLEFATQGFKDTTRIASSSPQMWKDICLSNSKNVIKSLDDLVLGLAKFRQAIVEHDEKTLMQHFTQAKEKRDSVK